VVTEKVTPVGADKLIIEDSEDSNNKKMIQITNLPSTGGVFGSTVEDFEDLTDRSTTAEDPNWTNYLPVAFTTAVVPAGRYRFDFEWAWNMPSVARQAHFQVLLDGSPITTDPFEIEPADAGNDLIENVWRMTNLTNAIHTIQLQYRVSTGAGATPTLTVSAFLVNMVRQS
jgi:hypothetical protein